MIRSNFMLVVIMFQFIFVAILVQHAFYKTELGQGQALKHNEYFSLQQREKRNVLLNKDEGNNDRLQQLKQEKVFNKSLYIADEVISRTLSRGVFTDWDRIELKNVTSELNIKNKIFIVNKLLLAYRNTPLSNNYIQLNHKYLVVNKVND